MIKQIKNGTSELFSRYGGYSILLVLLILSRHSCFPIMGVIPGVIPRFHLKKYDSNSCFPVMGVIPGVILIAWIMEYFKRKVVSPLWGFIPEDSKVDALIDGRFPVMGVILC